jgi:hypothetical protein
MNQWRKQIAGLCVALIAVLTLFAGCGQTGDPEILPPESNPSSEVSEPETAVNPLTGEEGFDEALLTTRPVAVMVNNIRAALPQSGLSQADIIYELPVEGGITRLMAVFSDYSKIQSVGSVRSCRHDYVELVLPLNAIYVHFGWSTMGKTAVEKYGVDNINGISMSNTAFYFDKERSQTKSSEHCWFTSAEYIQKGIDQCGYSTETDPLDPIFRFAAPGENVLAGKTAATNVTVPLSGAVTATFTYDSTSGMYKKGQFGQDHIDSLTGKAVEVKNVFLMYTDVATIDASGHKEIALESGTGYYLSNGVSVPVTFRKNGVNDPVKVYDESGQEIEVNAGKSWFCVIPKEEKSGLVME